MVLSAEERMGEGMKIAKGFVAELGNRPQSLVAGASIDLLEPN